MRSLRLLPLVLVVAAAGSGSAAGSGGSASARVAPPHILYVSDWSGLSQIYSSNLNGGPTGQVTFGRAPGCLPGTPCGYVQPQPSPDGRLLLFWGDTWQGPPRSRLFVARAAGRGRRQVAEVVFGNATWAPDSRRIAYGAASGVYVVNADGSGRRRVYRYKGALLRDRFAWSPDGRALGILHGGDLVLVRGSTRRVVARKVDDFAWSPSGDRLAYLADGLFLTRPDGSRPRRLAPSAQQHPFGLEWSSTGRWLAHNNGQSLRIVNVETRRTRDLDRPRCCAEPAWSPNGRWLAYDEVARGVTMVNAATGRIRRRGSEHATALAWSPLHTTLAYVVARDGHYPTGDVRVVTPNGYGPVSYILAGGGLGGNISGLTFVRPPVGTSYRRPQPRSLATVGRGELVAPSPIQRLAADGSRVAYTSCGHVFRWTPSTLELVQAEAVASLSPQCGSETYFTSQVPFGLAIAGDRVVHGSVSGSSSKAWWLGGSFVEAIGPPFTLGAGSMTTSSNFASYGALVGDPVGEGDLLVFSTWNRRSPRGGPCCTVSDQAILRAEPFGCPCPEIWAEPGPFVPFDVNDGRVAAVGDNELILLDRAGTQLLRVPVRALAAQLDGQNLVVLVRGQLRHYDTATGALVAAWPLPDVSAGTECTAPGGRECSRPSLVLQDAARGLVTYVLHDQVHVLRLADGRDAVVAPGTLARFFDEGLVYADGARLRAVPFAELPV